MKANRGSGGYALSLVTRRGPSLLCKLVTCEKPTERKIENIKKRERRKRK